MTKPLPLSVQLYERLRRSIILGEYPQGTPLYEQRLAEELNVSRVPIREAMPLLQNQGFIDTTPRRSAIVTVWTPLRINDVFDARLSLEVGAAGVAARRARSGGSPLAGLEAAMADAERHLETANARSVPEDALTQAELNGGIHLALVAAADNALLVSLMQAVVGRIIWLFYLTKGLTFGSTENEHHKMLDAMHSGNDRLAEALTIAHIEAGRKPTIDALAGTVVEVKPDPPLQRGAKAG